jgi:AcrR family transcriptional regulator
MNESPPAASAGVPQRRGRPVSQRSRAAALTAARELLAERGFARFTVDEVGRRSGVSKATIYKHWPDGFQLAVEAFGNTVSDAVPTVDTGDATGDLRNQFVRLAAFYASPDGVIATELIAAAVTRPGGAAAVSEHFFGRRRRETSALVEKGQRAGQIRRDLDTELVIDLLFGPIIFRLFNGLGALDADQARAIGPIAVSAISGDTERPGPSPAANP